MFDLNKPAFGPDAEKVEAATEPAEAEEVKKEEDEEEQQETKRETKEAEAKVLDVEESSEEEESNVKYSRFKSVNSRRKEAEAEAAYWRGIAEERERHASKTSESSQEETVPDWWIQLYGDNENSRKGWSIQDKAQQEIIAQAKREALEAVQSAQAEQEESLGQNMNYLDEQMDSLSDTLGRPLTANEESAVLDIVDEFTPSGKDGKYIAPPFPMDKAWEIYELRHQTSVQGKKASRDAVASLTGNTSRGQTQSEKEERDANWTPDWDSYKGFL